MRIFIDRSFIPVTQLKKLLVLAEWIFTVAYLVIYSAGVVALLLTKGANEGDSTIPQDFDFSLNRFLFLINYLVTTLLLTIRWKKTLYTLMSNSIIWVLLLLVPISALWSTDPSRTLNGSVGMFGTFLFGLYLASRYSFKQQLQLLGWMFGLSILLSFLFVIGVPRLGIMGGVHAGAWRGIYTHKNGLGKMMVLGSIVLLLLANEAQKYRKILWGLLGLCFSLIVLSRSTSSLLNSFIVLITAFASQAFRFRLQVLIPLILSATAIGVIWSLGAAEFAELVLGSVGKDLTLTGRTEIWPYVIHKIQERPWLGYGFSTFWNGLHGESAYIWKALRWTVPDSHNGFLDLYLDLGLVGLTIYLISFLQTLIQSTKLIRVNQFNQFWVSLWPLLFLVYIVLVNLSESTLFARNSLVWLLYVTLVFSCSVEMKRQHHLKDGLPSNTSLQTTQFTN